MGIKKHQIFHPPLSSKISVISEPLFLEVRDTISFCYFTLSYGTGESWQILFWIARLVNFFCRIVDWRKASGLISSRDHYQRFWPLQIFAAPRAKDEPAQNLRVQVLLNKVVVVISIAPRRYTIHMPHL